jgi:hypothetical protein
VIDEPDELDPTCANCTQLRKSTDPKLNPRILHHDPGHHTVTPRQS